MATKKETVDMADKADKAEELRNDMIDLGKEIVAGIRDGSCRDYYRSIDAVIKLYDSIK